MGRKQTYAQRGYPPEFSEEFKTNIRRRDGFKCSICSRKAKLDVHHIDYIKSHTTKLNCISLCRDCHDVIHKSAWIVKQDWKYRLWKLAAEREREHGKENKNSG